jgi:hypothetical protein
MGLVTSILGRKIATTRCLEIRNDVRSISILRYHTVLRFWFCFFFLFKGLICKLILSENSFVLNNTSVLDFKSLLVFFV